MKGHGVDILVFVLLQVFNAVDAAAALDCATHRFELSYLLRCLEQVRDAVQANLQRKAALKARSKTLGGPCVACCGQKSRD